jgi:hypothetical protein
MMCAALAKRAGSSTPIVDHSDQDSLAGRMEEPFARQGLKELVESWVKRHGVPVTEEGIIELVMHGNL